MTVWDEHGNVVPDAPSAQAWDANGNPIALPRRPVWETYSGVRQQPGAPNPVLAQQMLAERRRSLIDPAVARALASRAREAGDLVAQIPRLNVGQVASDTGRLGQQAWNQFASDPLGSTGNVLGAIPGVIWGATGKPLVDLGVAGYDESRAVYRGDPAAAEEAAGRGVNAEGGVALNSLGFGAGSLIRTPLQSAAFGGALALPTSLMSNQGTLQERLPHAITDTTGAAVIGGALGSLARNGRGAPADDAAGSPAGTVSTASPASRARDFQTARVRPTAAAIFGGTLGDVTKTLSENWLGGLTARSGLRRSIQDTADRAREMTRQAGDAVDHESAGEAVQTGVDRFATSGHEPLPEGHVGADPRSVPTQEWSWRAKARALYDQFLHPYDTAPAQPSNTRALLNTLRQQVRITPEPAIAQLSRVLDDNPSLLLQDLRTLREDVRMAQDPRNLTQTRNNAQLQQMERALTQDIYDSVHSAAGGGENGATAVSRLRQTDRYYATGMSRINNALRPFSFGPEGRPISGATVYSRIVQAMRDGGTQNTPRLQALMRSLRPDERRTVLSSILDEMGAPRAGKPGALEPDAFSVARFATEWGRLSNAAKNIMVPPELRAQLDALGRVADYQREVEAMANNSRSGNRVQNITTGGAAVTAAVTHNPLAIMAAGGAITGMNVTGAALTSPGFVRWLVRASSARAGGPAAGRALAQLRDLALRDPALVPVYNRLAASQRGSAPDQQEQLQPALQ